MITAPHGTAPIEITDGKTSIEVVAGVSPIVLTTHETGFIPTVGGTGVADGTVTDINGDSYEISVEYSWERIPPSDPDLGGFVMLMEASGNFVIRLTITAATLTKTTQTGSGVVYAILANPSSNTAAAAIPEGLGSIDVSAWLGAGFLFIPNTGGVQTAALNFRSAPNTGFEPSNTSAVGEISIDTDEFGL